MNTTKPKLTHTPNCKTGLLGCVCGKPLTDGDTKECTCNYTIPSFMRNPDCPIHGDKATRNTTGAPPADSDDDIAFSGTPEEALAYIDKMIAEDEDKPSVQGSQESWDEDFDNWFEEWIDNSHGTPFLKTLPVMDVKAFIKSLLSKERLTQNTYWIEQSAKLIKQTRAETKLALQEVEKRLDKLKPEDYFDKTEVPTQFGKAWMTGFEFGVMQAISALTSVNDSVEEKSK